MNRIPNKKEQHGKILKKEGDANPKDFLYLNGESKCGSEEHTHNNIVNLAAGIREEVLSKLDFLDDVEDEAIQTLIDQEILRAGKINHLQMEVKQRLARMIFNSIRGLDVLQQLIDDDDITEIMINGYQSIFIEKQGKLAESGLAFESKEKLEDVIQQMVSRVNRTVNEAKPIVDARLPDGSRVHVVLAPTALNGPAVTIRKFPKEPVTMQKLIEFGAITEDACLCLEKLVLSRYNIFISGGTGSGKTTLLGALAGYIPADERVITIEDSAELQIFNVPNLVSLETRDKNMEGAVEIEVQDLIKAALRMRPDRIIIGEVRDGKAAANMLQALNTGHSGLSTGHANGTRDMLNRLEALMLSGMDIPIVAARKQIASAIDILIHLGRMRDKSRKVLEITEVTGIQEGEITMNPIYRYTECEGGKLLRTENNLKNMHKLKMAGYQEL